MPRSASDTTLLSSIALVIVPTPPGTLARCPATSATSGRTSPTSPSGVLVMPTARDADLAAVPVLASYVYGTAGVVADKHRSQARHDTAKRQRRHPPGELGADRNG